MHYTWTCQCCGKQSHELSLSVALLVPDPWLNLSDTEREARGKISQDVCIIDDEHFFIRGCLEIPIIDYDNEVFVFGVWISVSKQNFLHIHDLWDAEMRDHEPPMFGWLCNNIRGYPETFSLKTHVHLRNNGKRPFIELEPTDHPLAREQRDGITLRRVEEIVSAARLH